MATPSANTPGASGPAPQDALVCHPQVRPVDLSAHLDHHHRTVLEMLPPGLMDLNDVPMARATLGALLGALPKPPLPDTVEIEQRTVPGIVDGSEVTVRVYRPRESPAVTPALLWIHGGGMVLGAAEMDDVRCAIFAEQFGIVVVSVDYRLAPEHPYPAPLDDCFAALTWLVDAADELGIDAGRIAIGGASAGGGLAAGLALRARDADGPAICFQFLLYPMIDDRNATVSSHRITDSRVWNRAANLVGWQCYLGAAPGDMSGPGGDEVPIHAAPSRATDLSGLPPAHISVGALDLFLDEDIAYASALTAAGVPCELHVYPGAFHGSNGFVPDAPVSRRWAEDDERALRAGLRLDDMEAR